MNKAQEVLMFWEAEVENRLPVIFQLYQDSEFLAVLLMHEIITVINDYAINVCKLPRPISGLASKFTQSKSIEEAMEAFTAIRNKLYDIAEGKT